MSSTLVKSLFSSLIKFNQKRFYSECSFTMRSHTCGQLSVSNVGEQVNLYGWIQYTRFDNRIISLKDKYGTIQCVASKEYWMKHLKKMPLYSGSVVQILGTIQERPNNQKKSDSPSAEVEIHLEQLSILSSARKDLPILPRGEDTLTQNTRLKYRYLDLRSPEMQQALDFRSEVCKILRDKLYELKFKEDETPTLANRTPGGANEFIVPSQLQDQFYSLVQSPQQFKQLLMIGGRDRYFQICRCYRDEVGRTDRQPEFTQLDIELSFTNQNLVMRLVEGILYDLFTRIKPRHFSRDELISSFNKDQQIPQMSFHEAFEKFGSDKPDTRFGCCIQTDERDNIFIEFPYTIDDTTVASILDEAKRRVGPELDLDPIFNREHDMLKVIILNDSMEARKLLGLVRIMIAKELDKIGKSLYSSRFKLLWVTDFPLFDIDQDGKLQSNHHPFTAPTSDTAHLLETNPLNVIGQHYDLVLNGQEVGGGSIRIHEAGLQKKIFTDILGLDERVFGYFVEALESGCPPHGGIAIGLDRLLSILLDRESIKEVIAFPKTNTGRDLMTNCPHEIDNDVLRLYHLLKVSTC